MKPCNQKILETIEMAKKLIELADEGDRERNDDGCGVLFGVVRDSAYKIKALAEDEKRKHQEKGAWD